MTVTSGNLKLFKPQANPAGEDDYVDVIADIQQQMLRVDNYCWPYLRYRANSSNWTSQPMETVPAARRYSDWNCSPRAYSPVNGQWNLTMAEQNAWIPVDPGVFVAPYTPHPTNPVFYRFAYLFNQFQGAGSQIHIMFRGKIVNAGVSFATLPLAVNTSLISLAGLPTPDQDTRQIIRCGRGGLANTDQFQYNRISVLNADSHLYGNRIPCGGAAGTQTAGNTENYYEVDGFSFRTNL